MNSFEARTGVSIDGGAPLPSKLYIEWAEVDMSTGLPQPNPNWSVVDSNGHFHAYDQKAEGGKKYPTLVEKSRHVDCDGRCGDDPDECDGWTEVWHECAICGEVVKPGSIPGPHRIVKPGLMTWWVELVTEVPIEREKVSVRVISGGEADRFGLAYAFLESVKAGAGTPALQYRLTGAGPLGTCAASVLTHG